MKKLHLIGIIGISTMILTGCGISPSQETDNLMSGDTLSIEENTTLPEINESYVQTARNNYIGLTLEDANNLAETLGQDFRVVIIDNEQQPITMDYRIGRINAHSQSGIIVDLDIEGAEEFNTENNTTTIQENNDGQVEAAKELYIGLSDVAAMQLANRNNTPFRIIMIDNQPQAITLDFQLDRVNAIVESGIVVDVDLG